MVLVLKTAARWATCMNKYFLFSKESGKLFQMHFHMITIFVCVCLLLKQIKSNYNTCIYKILYQTISVTLGGIDWFNSFPMRYSFVLPSSYFI